MVVVLPMFVVARGRGFELNGSGGVVATVTKGGGDGGLGGSNVDSAVQSGGGARLVFQIFAGFHHSDDECMYLSHELAIMVVSCE